MSYYSGRYSSPYSSSKDRTSASPSRYSSYSPYSSSGYSSGTTGYTPSYSSSGGSAYASPYSSSYNPSSYSSSPYTSSGLTAAQRSGSTSSLSSVGSGLSSVSGTSGVSARSSGTTDNGSRPFTSRRYGSASDVPTQMASSGPSDRAGDRSSYHHRYSRRQPTTGIALSDNSVAEPDYKKLYEEVKSENDGLKMKVDSLTNDLKEAQTNKRNSSTTNGESLSDKRGSVDSSEDDDCFVQSSDERRALERRISELEEELKKQANDSGTLKSDNLRLKEENGALIRVISKLSK